MDTFSWKSRFEASAEEVFRWHERPGSFERLLAPWESTQLLERTGALEPGSRSVFSVSTVWPLRHRWVADHVTSEPPHQFVDVQRQGPFAAWTHTHQIEPDGPQACTLEDRIEYRLPLGWAGRLAGSSFVRSRLAQVFRYRHELTRRDLMAHATHCSRGGQPLRVAITGSGGVLGSALGACLTTGGHQTLRLIRDPALVKPGASAHWDPARGVDPAALEGCDAVVHLAGSGIAESRWSPEVKGRIQASRAPATRLLCESIARMQRPPRTLVCASAIGYYGDRGDDLLDEEAPAGTGFLGRVCEEWEAATRPALDRGVRVVRLRIGVVLSTAGGALSWMLPFFSLGLGGPLGSGKQWMSWVDRDDVVRAILHILDTESLQGPVNVVSANPATQAELARTLGRVLGRPAFLRVPARAIRWVLGEMADEMLLASQRVSPEKLLRSGFEPGTPVLEDCLRKQLARALL